MYEAFDDLALLGRPSSPTAQPSLQPRMLSTPGCVSALLCHGFGAFSFSLSGMLCLHAFSRLIWFVFFTFKNPLILCLNASQHLELIYVLALHTFS